MTSPYREAPIVAAVPTARPSLLRRARRWWLRVLVRLATRECDHMGCAFLNGRSYVGTRTIRNCFGDHFRRRCHARYLRGSINYC